MSRFENYRQENEYTNDDWYSAKKKQKMRKQKNRNEPFDYESKGKKSKQKTYRDYSYEVNNY